MNKEQNNPSILLVDEDVFLLGIYARRLRDCNWDIDYATSSEEAVEILTRKSVDVVVLDVMVGTQPGVEILRFFKEKNLGGKVATVILSNNDDPGSVEEAQQLGADGYIVKAHNTPSEVVEEIEKIHTQCQGAEVQNKTYQQ